VIDGKIKEISQYLDTELVTSAFGPLDSASIEASARARSLADATAFYATISKFVSTATQLVRRQPFDSATPARQRGKTG
jgi:hypothetical protein